MKSLAAIILALLGMRSFAAPADLPKWGPFVETDFPFYSTTLDARSPGFTNNLTPRALVFNAGANIQVAFDIDLLRVAAIWQGPGVTPVSMAQGSYSNETWGKKAPEGQDLLPKILGVPLLLSGAFAGVQIGENLSPVDPRPPGGDVGRGPLPPGRGQFKAIQFSGRDVSLEYEIADLTIRESFSLAGNTLTRRIQMPPHQEPFTFYPGSAVGDSAQLRFESLVAEASDAPAELLFHLDIRDVAPAAPAKTRDWKTPVQTGVRRVATNDAYRIEHLGLPINNPWKRNIRFADIAFFQDGRAALVTFDGDVWIVDGLSGGQFAWRRFSSGLHEPLSIAIRGERIYVFDRNGIWRIVDSDGDGLADRHEMLCNRFAQTAETREFALSMKLAPDGSFIIAKPGQTGSTVGADAGKILRVSEDGNVVTTLGRGFRQPFLGVNPQTGLITCSDQQGHYVPTTPLHVIRGDQYYGFRPVILPRESQVPKIAEPLLWIPHSINASGASQVWLREGMGPLSNSLLHLGYYRSEIFAVLWSGSPNAAILSFTRDLDFAPLNASMHPEASALFVVGFQLWGATAPEISGLARFTPLAKPSALPREILPMREGVLLRFHEPVAESSVRPDNFSAERWNYRRSPEYGSPHFKLDGTKGQETIFASSAFLSKDRRSIFVGFPDMRAVMTMRVGWALASEGGVAMQNNAYLTPRSLAAFEPARHGFPALKVDLSPRTLPIQDETPVTVAEGKRLADLMGCAACHSTDGSTLGKVGPSWKGLAGSNVPLADGSSALADAEYLRQSIREPAARVVRGFDKSDTGMPSYEGVLTSPQIEALVLYIQSLR